MRKKIITIIALLAGLSLLSMGLTLNQFGLIDIWLGKMAGT